MGKIAACRIRVGEPLKAARERRRSDFAHAVGQHRAVAGLERRHFLDEPQVFGQRRLPAVEMQQMIQ